MVKERRIRESVTCFVLTRQEPGVLAQPRALPRRQGTSSGPGLLQCCSPCPPFGPLLCDVHGSWSKASGPRRRMPHTCHSVRSWEGKPGARLPRCSTSPHRTQQSAPGAELLCCGPVALVSPLPTGIVVLAFLNFRVSKSFCQLGYQKPPSRIIGTSN